MSSVTEITPTTRSSIHHPRLEVEPKHRPTQTDTQSKREEPTKAIQTFKAKTTLVHKDSSYHRTGIDAIMISDAAL